jgi:hypothetical protein
MVRRMEFRWFGKRGFIQEESLLKRFACQPVVCDGAGAASDERFAWQDEACVVCK